MESGGTWLCPTGHDRERLLDMEVRLKPTRAAAMGLLAAVLLLSGPWIGWWTLIPLALAALGFVAVDARLEHARRPELGLALAWLFSQLAIAGSVVLTGGATSPALAWLAIPVVTLGARFSARGLAAGASVSAVLMVGAALSSGPSVVLADPQLVLFPLALLGAVAILVSALMASDRHHRSEAVVDGLTGMLNRKALDARVAELEQQSALTGQPVGVVVGDLDRFKAVNDEHGHQTGDAVLRDVAYVLRKQLRAFDLAYRLGGEEFLVLLPGATERQALEVASRLRRAIASSDSAGLKVTMSFGVSASAPEQPLCFTTVLGEADRALYVAKDAGRNRVCAAHPHLAGSAPSRRMAAVAA